MPLRRPTHERRRYDAARIDTRGRDGDPSFAPGRHLCPGRGNYFLLRSHDEFLLCALAAGHNCAWFRGTCASCMSFLTAVLAGPRLARPNMRACYEAFELGIDRFPLLDKFLDAGELRVHLGFS